MAEDRQLIFISHANPEDNEFVLWLSSRLTSLGYLVWADVTQLFGAEKFWQDIEDAIRNHSAKVIVVLSRISQTKDGVLNEVHTALAVEKKNKFNRFVIPIRIDDLPSTDINSVLIQKGYIDFFSGWAQGFKKLLRLFDKEEVPRRQSQDAKEYSRWIDRLLSGPVKVTQQPQEFISNRFSITSLPERLNFFRVPVPNEKLKSLFACFDYPVYPYRDMIATFASLEDIDSHLPEWQVPMRAHEILLSDLLHGRPHSLEGLEWPEISRMLSYLIRDAWDSTMLKKDLRAYVLANGKKAWFPVDRYTEKNTTIFTGMDGMTRRRKLVGYSKKRAVFWHLAVAAYPFIGFEPYLLLRSHVPFSDDGKTPLASDKKMHSLRRSFCRNWWNDRWRDLLLAYTSQVSDKDNTILLSVGSDQELLVSTQPQIFESPVSIQGINEVINIEDETNEQLDKLADQADLEIDQSPDMTIDEEENDDTNESN